MVETDTPLTLFQATCEALEVLPGARRLDAFLRLPESTQDAIWSELFSDEEIYEGNSAE